MILKSPGGSNYPYYFKGGEIHCLKYGGFFEDEGRLFEIMDAEESFIRKLPSRKWRIWVDFYETKLSGRVMERFAAQMSGIAPRLVKLAIVGCSLPDRRRLKRELNRGRADFPVPCRCFDDPEEAKEWLVSDNR